MTPLGNDRWTARFTVQAVGRYVYSVRGWIDHFKTWRRDLRKRLQAGQDVSVGFAVNCPTPAPGTGSIRIAAATTGSNPDPDGYTVMVTHT